VFGPVANATLEAVRDAPDLVHRCTKSAREALQSLAKQYPLEPLVRQAARTVMPECRDQASLAALLASVPREARTRDESLDLIRIELRNLSRFADAESEVKPFVDADPNDTETLSLFAAALYYQGRFAEAAPLVDRRWTVIVREENTDIMTMRADQFMKDGRPDRAEAILKDVLSLNPNHLFAINTLRQVQTLRGDEAGAAVLASTAEAIDAIASRRERAMAEANQRFQDLVTAFDAFDYPTAEKIAKELIGKAEDDSMRTELYSSLAAIYFMQGRMDDSLAARDQASHFAALATSVASGTPVSP
ncbi:MAG: hypothetical protein ABI780_06005, partial [Ardenticatenales bacterium]